MDAQKAFSIHNNDAPNAPKFRVVVTGRRWCLRVGFYKGQFDFGREEWTGKFYSQSREIPTQVLVWAGPKFLRFTFGGK